MKSLQMIAGCLMLAAGAVAQTKAHPGFDKMRTLVGQWEGKSSGGDVARVTYALTAGDQPRMRGGQVGADPREISFTFQDATNLPNPAAGHMVGLILAWQDKDRITQVWTWREKGKPDMNEKFELVRRK